MNLALVLYLSFNDAPGEIEALLAEISDVLVARGYANERDAEQLSSLLLVKEIHQNSDTVELIENELAEAAIVIVPTKGEYVAKG